MANISIQPSRRSNIVEVSDGNRALGTITQRGSSHFPEPAMSGWAQDELYFATQAEAVAFLLGARWMADNH